MKNTIKIICTLVSALILFTSCQSVYIGTPSPSIGPDESAPLQVDEEEEYYTPGTLFNSGDIQNGFMYYDYWIYEEGQYYKELATVSPSGKKTYNEKYASRLVKVNTATGVVSSLCLDPVCNHSPRSGCPMIAPEGWGIYIPVIVGDWVVVEKTTSSEVYGRMYECFAYNPLTGDKQDILINEYGEMTVTEWAGMAVFGNKLYSIRRFMDYSNTGYVPGGDKPMSSFTPETVCVFSYYDFDSKKTVELFEVPAGYAIYAVTNKRFFFRTPEGEIFSTGYDGKNPVKEDVFDFIITNKIGPYAYHVNKEIFLIYDLRTNTKKQIDVPFTRFQRPAFTKSGILYDTWTTMEEWDKALDGYAEFKEAHPDLRGSELQNAFMEECNKLKYAGTAQIWRSNFEGEELELIFEKENAVISTVCGNDKYLFGFVVAGDPNNGYKEIAYENEGRSMINLETGEITPVPYCELIPPSDEMMMEIINSNE